jgi:hypothetical protein
MAVALVVTLPTIKVVVVLVAIRAQVVIKEAYQPQTVAAQPVADIIQVHTDLVLVVA